MDLSMKFLYLQLKKHYDVVRLNLPSNDNLLCSSVRLKPESTWIPARDTLYIMDCSWAELKKSALPRTTRLILFDNEPPQNCAYPCLIFPRSYSRSQVLNDLLAIFYRYDRWSQQVTEAILKNQSLQEILHITQTVEENPMYFADPSFKMLAQVSQDMEEFSVIWRYQLRYGYLPFNVMMDLVETGELEMLHDAIPAIYADTKSFTSKFISKAIRYKGKVHGHFFIIQTYRHLNQCDLEIADYLGNLVSAAIYEDDNYLTMSSLYHEHFMIDILENTLHDKDLIKNQLKPLGWRLTGDYRLLGVHMQDDEDALKRNAITLLSDGWNAQAFLYEHYLIVVYNEPPRKYDALLEHIHHFLKLLNRYAALSEPFSNFTDMSLYYQQILFTLQHRDLAVSDRRLFLYEDYFLAHLVHLTAENLPEYKPVSDLHAYDMLNHSDYCHTLYTYLMCEQNTVKTAQLLFLHRNTLKYRMEKILDIIKVTLDRPMIRQRILFSLYALENVKKE